jgi:hypothetical protein
MNSYSTNSDQWEGTELETSPILSPSCFANMQANHLLSRDPSVPRKSWKQIFAENGVKETWWIK